MKLFNAINHMFLHGEDEKGTVSDYVWFYGFNGGSLLISLILLVKIITM